MLAIMLQSLVYRPIGRQAAGESPGVLQSHGRPLSQVGRQRMRRVAEHRQPSPGRPRRDRPGIGNRMLQNGLVIRGGDELLHWCMPSVKQAGQHFAPTQGIVGSEHVGVRRCVPVGPSTAHRGDPKATAGAPGLGNPAVRPASRRPVDKGTPANVALVPQRSRPGQGLPQPRRRAVRHHDQWSHDVGPIADPNPNAVLLQNQRRRLVVEMQRFARKGSGENPLQVAAPGAERRLTGRERT